MSHAKSEHGSSVTESALPERGESAIRRQRLEEHGGQPLTDAPKDGELRGADEGGRPTTGTHGGPVKSVDEPMTLTADLESAAHIDREELAGELFGEPAGKRVTISRAAGVLGPAIAMSAACLTALLSASSAHARSPWAGLQALPIGVLGPRTPKTFQPSLALGGIGVIVGGSLVVAGVLRMLPAGILRNRVGTALSVAASSFGIDRLVMRRALVPTLVRTLGSRGTVAKYALMGIAAGLASNETARKASERAATQPAPAALA